MPSPQPTGACIAKPAWIAGSPLSGGARGALRLGSSRNELKWFSHTLPPPPPPPCNPPPPLATPPPPGGRPSLHCFARHYLLWWFVLPSVAHTFLHCFPSTLNQSPVCSVIFSLQRRCTGCRVPFSDPRCFLPVAVYGTTHAHLVRMCWPLLWGLEIPLQSPPPPGAETVTWRPSPPWGEDRLALRAENSRGWGGRVRWVARGSACLSIPSPLCVLSPSARGRRPLPPPAGDPYHHRTRTLRGTEIAPENEIRQGQKPREQPHSAKALV